MKSRVIRQPLMRTRVLIPVLATLFALSVLVHQMYFARRAQAVSTSVVISQIYGGAGCGTAGCSTYKNDYIELFNRGNVPVSLNGWSVQYAAAAGTSWQVTNLTNFTLQPGQYYLVQEGVGANGSINIPAPDAPGTIAMSATAGKVALVSSTVALSGACPVGVVDLIGYGTANCFETALAAAPGSNSNADIRNGAGCTETDNNSTDFTATTANPRNTSTALNPCGGGGTPTLNVSNPTQAEGNAGPTTFTFNVTLTSPAGAGGVSFNWATADGTAQDDNPIAEDNDYVAASGTGFIPAAGTSTSIAVQVNGDTTPESSETFFVNLTGITGTTNTTASGTGTITNDDITITPIYTIQGSGMASPLTGNSVTTTGIVTGKRSFGATNYGFYIQDPLGDGNVNTSDAILVFTGSTVPTVNVGDAVQVSGTVSEFEPSPTDEPNGVAPPDPKTATEITGATTSVQSSGNPLPAALDVTTNNILDPAATSRGAELEKYEYMRLSVSSLTVSEPTNNFGEFYGVESTRPRPFREPGIEAGDPIPNADEPPYAPNPPPFPPSFDGNFERIMVDSGAALTTGSTRRTQVQVTTGTVVTTIAGPLDYAFDAYRIVLDASATPGVAGGMTAAVPVPVRLPGEFTIGHANLENFSASNAGRMNKASLAVRNVLRTPDVLGLIEIDNLSTAQQLAAKINADAADPGVNYVAYLSETSATQDIGYLVNTARVQVVGTPQQYHVATQFTYCGVTSVLHDRPSFILTANMPRSGGGTVSVTVILNHTKSLIATDSPVPYGSCGTGTEGARNREKRRQQAEDIADLIQAHSSENLVVLGDLNAMDFNDGLGDVVGTFRGDPVPPEQVVEPSVDRWSYQLTNLVYTVPADQQYSLLFEGNAQALDHVLLNSQMLAQKTGFAYARYNADFSDAFATNTNTPERVADHDAPVAYFSFPADTDNDGVIDANDNCPTVANSDQTDTDGDTMGNACDTDDDGDGVSDADEIAAGSDPLNAASTPEVCDGVDNDLNEGIDEGFVDTDHDGQADCVDADDDNDGQSDADEIACGSDPLNASSKSLDTDGDNIPDCADTDDDNDGVLDGADNCPLTANSGQADNDHDGVGDVCDPDDDNDGVLDGADNCPFIANSGQADNDHDGIGDVCDPDDDNDGVLDGADNCPFIANSGQADNDHDGVGDVCDPDDDNDGVLDGADNCPLTANSGQADNDHDGIGDVCDPDDDNDGVLDGADNCPFTANSGQADNDHDGIGDVCDPDDDNDGVLDVNDNCPFTYNPDQADFDHNGVGDACEPAPRLIKQAVLNQLIAFRATVTDKEDGKKLDEAIKHLQKSLDPDLWIDDSHPKPQGGEKVFNEEKDTVNQLKNLMKDKHSTIPDATIQGWINRIVQADRFLAQVAINDAVARGGDPKKIAKANEELTKGDADAAGKPDNAIEHYRNAWDQALKS